MPPIRAHLLVVICAISAGVHAVLAPMHFHEGSTLGIAFGVSAAALAAVAVALDRRPESRPAMHAAALLLGGLIAAYVATRVATVPLVGEHREAVDAVGLATKLVELLGLLLAIRSINKGVARRMPAVATEKGVMS